MQKITLYIATHNTTGLKYFGKSSKYFTESDLQKHYHGSGTYWTNHLSKYGDDVTMKIYGIYSIESVKEAANDFSEKFNIINSDAWANLIIENGLDDWDNTGTISVFSYIENKNIRISIDEFWINRNKYKTISEGMVNVFDLKSNSKQIPINEYKSNKDKYKSMIVGNNFGTINKGTVVADGKRITVNEFHNGNYKTVLDGHKYKDIICPHCGFNGSGGNMKRYHFDNCHKISINNKAFNVFDKNGVIVHKCISTREVRNLNQQLIFTNKNKPMGSSKNALSRLISTDREHFIGMYIEEIVK